MNSLTRYWLMVIVVGLSCGCAQTRTESRHRPKASPDALFQRVLADCGRAGCDTTASISLLQSQYWLPESVEPLIKQGDKVIPFLEEASSSTDFSRRELALVCIYLIQAKRVEKGEPRRDAKSGIVIVSYCVWQ